MRRLLLLVVMVLLLLGLPRLGCKHYGIHGRRDGQFFLFALPSGQQLERCGFPILLCLCDRRTPMTFNKTGFLWVSDQRERVVVVFKKYVYHLLKFIKYLRERQQQLPGDVDQRNWCTVRHSFRNCSWFKVLFIMNANSIQITYHLLNWFWMTSIKIKRAQNSKLACFRINYHDLHQHYLIKEAIKQKTETLLYRF